MISPLWKFIQASFNLTILYTVVAHSELSGSQIWPPIKITCGALKNLDAQATSWESEYLVWNRAWHNCFVLLFSVSSGDSNMQAELKTTELELEDNGHKGVSLIPGSDSGLLSFTLFFGHRLSGCYNIVCNWFEGVWPGQVYIAGWPLINQETI